MSTKEQIQQYLETTGQTQQQLSAGAVAYGLDFIYHELVPRALKEHKKIVWVDRPDKGLGAMDFSLEDI